MLYVIYSRDRENALAARFEARPRHLERVEKLLAEGRHGLRSPREPPLSEGELDDLIAFVLSL
mgnify:CR=1 FL=1